MKEVIRRGIYAVLMAIILILTIGNTAFAETSIGVEPGQEMPDFTVSQTEGSTATLSEVLKEKDLVVLNFFASWCGPCEREFPEMEAVYQDNKDHMEIISLSFDPDDTMEIISEYKESHGLSFAMGLKESDLSYLEIVNVPTTVFVDRNGKVGFIKVGAFLSREEFEDKVNFFLSPAYEGETLATEKAFNWMSIIAGYILISGLFLIIGRWGILKKAGKKGWHSLIPFLNIYQEFSVCWKGWIGLASSLCFMLTLVSNYIAQKLNLPGVVGYILCGIGCLLYLPESLKLAKAFGKNRVWGVLMFIPGFKEICRVILAISRAKYQYTED